MDIDAEVSNSGIVTISFGLFIICTCGRELTIHASSIGAIEVSPCRDCMSDARGEGMEAMNPDY
jgi:hypothetical protein